MSARRALALGLVTGAGVAATGYLAYALVTWFRYSGRKRSRIPSSEQDAVLDCFMPDYDVRDYHQIRVHASAQEAMRAARGVEWQRSPVVRAIFKGREFLLGAQASAEPAALDLIGAMKEIGWQMLSDDPQGELVMGAATRPWMANPRFLAIDAERFREFRDPEMVKIVWTIRVKPVGENESVICTETRSQATDSAARAKFGPYWAFLSPGIKVIRQVILRTAKRQAEGYG